MPAPDGPVTETGAPTRLDFEAVPWEEPLPKMRQKLIEQRGRRFRIVEFQHGFVEPGWCVRDHVGYVIEGRLEIAFAEHTETYEAGDGLYIRGGPHHAHRATALTDRALLFLYDMA